MRVTKAQLAQTCGQFAADIEKLREERDEARSKYEVEKQRHTNSVDIFTRAQKHANQGRERDREALLTAENRVCELEAAIVSLAVRVA